VSPPPHPLAPPPRDAPERMAEAKRMLREADANGDGKISRAEFSGLLRENVTPDSLSLYDNRLRFSGIAAPSA
jgi:calcium-dependent protein kinase